MVGKYRKGESEWKMCFADIDCMFFILLHLAMKDARKSYRM